MTLWPIKSHPRRSGGVKARFAPNLCDPEVKLKTLTRRMPLFGQFSQYVIFDHFDPTGTGQDVIYQSGTFDFWNLRKKLSLKPLTPWSYIHLCQFKRSLCYRDRAFRTKHNNLLLSRYLSSLKIKWTHKFICVFHFVMLVVCKQRH